VSTLGQVASPRSVAELLPRPFDTLSLTDVEEILEGIREEGESIFFECKEEARKPLIAKSCAAFANSHGGLLMVGVDDDGNIVGTDLIADPQVWVKDVLQSAVRPMPPFRARFLETEADRGLLLILVEESSVTPHLLTKTGVIYIRRPSSSDPVHLDDHRTLAELYARGQAGRDRAGLGFQALRHWNHPGRRVLALALVSTGQRGDPVFALHVEQPNCERLFEALACFPAPGTRVVGIPTPAPVNLRPTWEFLGPDCVRSVSHPLDDLDEIDRVFLRRSGEVVFERREVPRRQGGPDRDLASLDLDRMVIPWFEAGLGAGRDLLLDLGGHGDLRVEFEVEWGGRHMLLDQQGHAKRMEHEFRAGHWAELGDAGNDRTLLWMITNEMRRAMGLRPVEMS
jgi:hypothetical protein